MLVIDAAHDARGDRRPRRRADGQAVVCTHAHNDHINAAPELAELTGAPIRLHPADQVLWDQVYRRTVPYEPLADGEKLEVGGIALEVLHTPGHAPGAVCLYAPDLGVAVQRRHAVQGRPRRDRPVVSRFDTIIDSIPGGCWGCRRETVVHTGHGDSTSIGAEAPHLEEWIARGH